MPEVSRRTLLQAAPALALLPVTARARVPAAEEVVQLWPGSMPGERGATIHSETHDQSHDPAHPDRWMTGTARPVLIVHRPERPNGSAALVVPGGSYTFLSYDNEGTSQARWLNAQGVTAFILMYRLPGEGWDRRADVPLQDAQRAMRVIRAGASGFGIDAARIAVLGFSAGGHLAGSLATCHAEQVYAPADSADKLPARPDVAALIYPVVTLAGSFVHAGSRDALLGAGAPPAELQRRSVETRVDAATPPIFLLHASDDGLVPVENSLALHAALLAAKRPAELHVFDEGGHGFGVRASAALPASNWPRLFSAFAARKGVFAA